MTIQNGSFEVAGGTASDAYLWEVSSGGASDFAGFDVSGDFHESFLWGSYLTELDPTTSTWLFFDGSTEPFEEFDWGGVLVSDWSSSWLETTEEDFGWGTFVDVWVPGVAASVEDFGWGTFDDVWVPGDVCEFALAFGTSDYETFESGW